MIPFNSLWLAARVYRYGITPKRVLNLTKNATSMWLAHWFKKPIVWGYPPVLMVEPTNICNLRCPMCPAGNGEMTRPRGKMEVDYFRELIDEMGDYLMLVMFWNQGEPFINKKFTDMVRIAKTKKIPTMTSTNGHFFHTPDAVKDVIDSGLDEMIVSLDGTNAESYNKYRVGGDFDRVLDGIKAVCVEKKRQQSITPIINLQLIIFKHNEHEIDQLKKMAVEFGVDKLTLKTTQIYNSEQANIFLPENEVYRRYDFDGNQLEVRTKHPHGCYQLWYKTVVNWDGRVAPCCFDKNIEYELGNVFEEDIRFMDVWKGKKYQKFRAAILQSRKNIPMCQNCLEGVKGNYEINTSIK